MARHRAKRALGQNFLVDPNLRRKIVEAVHPAADDEILEVGPGQGSLTQLLAGAVRRLVLVELDDVLAAELQRRYGEREDVTVLHADILGVDPAQVVDRIENLKVVGNIPYNITTPIVFHLLRLPRPADIVLMVQEEVADRMAAAPGTGAYGALSVGIQTVARVRRLFAVGRKAFRPIPRVDSAVVRITPLRPSPLEEPEERALRIVVRSCFQWRRKQMGRILRDHPELGIPPDDLPAVAEAAHIDLRDRPERLSPAAFIALSRQIRVLGGPGAPPGERGPGVAGPHTPE